MRGDQAPHAMPPPPPGMPERGRFAPSPTGALHFGSLVAALGSWLAVRSRGGEWHVRIEDIDPAREVPGAAKAILRTLDACGLQADGRVAWQSRQTAAHAQSLARLVAEGHAYACHCSRSELAPFGGIHPARCVGRNHGRRPAWRVRVGATVIAVDDAIQGPLVQDLAREVGDFVIWRADGACAYQLAVVLDDAELGVTQVVRGADLLDSTPRQVFLQRLLGLPQPAHAHLPLVLDADGRKLSKQDRALPVDAADPLPPLRHALAFLGQPVPRAGTPARLLALAASAFDLARVPRAVPTPFAATRQETS